MNINGGDIIQIEITDKIFRRMLLSKARFIGCDLDGDILMHDGAKFIVYILEDKAFLVIDEEEK